MTLPTTLRRIGPLTIALTLALAANFAYSAWSQPKDGVVPPNGNTEPPIDVSDSDQDKEGSLSIGGILGVFGGLVLQDGTQGDGYILTSNASGVATWQDPATLEVGGGGADGSSCGSLDHMEVSYNTSCSYPSYAMEPGVTQCVDGEIKTLQTKRCSDEGGSMDP